MPKLNKLLVTSIIADIKECVHVSNEIYSWLGGIEHLSWKFPTKTAKDINAMEIVKEHDGTAGEFYILLLELAYDRLFNTFFAPPPLLFLLLYSLLVRSVSFRICINSKITNHIRTRPIQRNGERERERRIKKMVSFVHGWESWRRIVSTHAKVGATQLGMQMFRQRGRNTFRADEMQTLARCGWSLR